MYAAPPTVWAASSTDDEWPPEAKAMVVTFPTRQFYIHAPSHKLRLVDVERSLRKNASGLPLLLKYFDGSKAKLDTSAARTNPDPESVYKGAGIKYLGQATFGNKLKGHNCSVAATQPDENGFVQYQMVQCDAAYGNEYFEIEGMKFSALFTKPENVPYDPSIDATFCDEEPTIQRKNPTIYIEDYLTTSEVRLIEPYTLKDGTVISEGRLQCRPDQLNPDGVVKCSRVGWDVCDARPFFGDRPKSTTK